MSPQRQMVFILLYCQYEIYEPKQKESQCLHNSCFLVGKLVIADTNQPIVLRTKHILIGNKGELHIGSPVCPYKGNLTVILYGRYVDGWELSRSA